MSNHKNDAPSPGAPPLGYAEAIGCDECRHLLNQLVQHTKKVAHRKIAKDSKHDELMLDLFRKGMLTKAEFDRMRKTFGDARTSLPTVQEFSTQITACFLQHEALLNRVSSLRGQQKKAARQDAAL